MFLVTAALVFGIGSPAALAEAAVLNLSEHGYPYSWTSDDGWFLNPGAALNDFAGIVVENVESAEICAGICAAEDAEYPGGAWSSGTKDCFCESKRQMACLEPCLGEEEISAITFSKEPNSSFERCDKSFCEYYASDDGEWCNEVGFDLNECKEKTGRASDAPPLDSSGVPDLSQYGYPHRWTSDDGWFLHPNSSNMDAIGRISFSGIESVEWCAEICSAEETEHPAGSWSTDTKDCFCEVKLICLEPCLGEEEIPAIIFSMQPNSDFERCEKSYCEYYASDDGEWCREVGFDVEECKEKTGRSSATAPFDPDLPDLSRYGFPYRWTSDDGWFLSPNSSNVSAYAGISFLDVESAESCAELCSAEDTEYLAGGWNLETMECFCEQNLTCLEPCLGEEETPGVTFSKDPYSSFERCDKSYCEYYASEEEEWCSEVGFDLDKCKENTGRSSATPLNSSSLPDLSRFGYPHSWTSDDGLFLHPNASNIEVHASISFSGIESAATCAELCSAEDTKYPAGAWKSATKDCSCELELICLEPCLGKEETPAIVFSKWPNSGFERCEKSYCEYHASDQGEWCSKVGFNLEECKEKTGRKHTQGASESFDVSSKSAAFHLSPSAAFSFALTVALLLFPSHS